MRTALIVIAAQILTACSLIAEQVDRSLNLVALDHLGQETVPDDPQFFQSLFVADLHADTLLWDRDLLRRAAFGHADLPRLQAGNVGLQVFFAVTRTPLGTDPCVDADGFSPNGLLSFLQLRPVDTWFSMEARAKYQSERLMRFAERSLEHGNGASQIVVIREFADLQRVVESRRAGRLVMGALLGLEGVHWLGQDGDSQDAITAGVDRMHDAGFRVIALTHRFDNGLAGSSEGCARGPLTAAGELVLAHAESRGMILDLAHISPAAFAQALASDRGPLFVSHVGVQADCRDPCESRRNLSPDEIRAVARNGGVIGVGFWPEAVGVGVEAIANAMEAIVSALSKPGFVAEMTAGAGRYDPFDHIAFGSDFDGAVTTPFDASGISLLVDELRRRAENGRRVFPDAAIRKIAGTNVCRVLATRLPGGGRAAASELCRDLRQPDTRSSP